MEHKSEIQSESIKLRPVENGFILCWDVCKQVNGNNGPYSGTMKYYKEEEIFKSSESAQAIKRMVEIYKDSSEEMGEEDEYEGPTLKEY